MSLSPHTDASPTKSGPRNSNDLRLGPRRTAAMLVFVASWVAVVGGFYGWRALHASKADLATRIQDVSNPKTQQDATIEMAARMKQHDPEIKRWYPALLSMANGQNSELRGIAAWVMANDPGNEDFHRVLLKLSRDSAPSVRANAAVSLVNFKDSAGHQTIVDMLNDPRASSDQQWEALRALRVIGSPEDLPLATKFQNSSEERIRDVAADAAQDITDRMKEQKSRRRN